jgi:hypothetical protein
MGGSVIGFVEGVLEQEGAAVEHPLPDRLAVLLPDELQDELGLEELATLVVGEDGASGGAVACGYGTELLGAVARLALGRQGRVFAGTVDWPFPPPRPPKCYEGLNLSLKPGDVTEAPLWNLIGFGRYEATCDDLREGLITVAVSAAQGVPITLPELEAFPCRPIDLEDLPAELLRSGFARLREAMIAEAVSQVAGFREAVSRRHRRDAERVDRYFAEVAEDLRKRMRTRRDAAGLESKLDALPAERQRRRAQLSANHAIQVGVDLVALVALRGPGLRTSLEVRRRKHEVSIPVSFDALANEWVALRCDGCGRPTLAFAMCDEAAHLLCRECWDSCGTGGHRECFRCAGKPLHPFWQRSLAKPPPGVDPVAETPAPPPAARPTAPPPTARPTAPPPAARPTAPPPVPVRLRGPAREVLASDSDTPDLSTLRRRVGPRGPLMDARLSTVSLILKRHGRPLTSGEIRREIEVTAEALWEVLNVLEMHGFVEKTGQRRGTRYCWIGP